jgi:uncharacterized protein YdiU (UPF0061 family)
MRAKLGLPAGADDGGLVVDALALLEGERVDFTSFFRALPAALRGDDARARALFPDDPAAFDAWAARWRARIDDPAAAATAMDATNPAYIPRNHLVEHALAAATAGDLGPFEELLAVVRRPFEERPGVEAFAAPAPREDGPYRTFCGT